MVKNITAAIEAGRRHESELIRRMIELAEQNKQITDEMMQIENTLRTLRALIASVEIAP